MTDAQGGLPDSSGATPQMPRSELHDKGGKDTATKTKAEIPLDYSSMRHGVDVNMEAPISNEDLIHAGGLGARDELGSVVPRAVDGTDYEESLMEAMDYEDPADAKTYLVRPGLGASHEEIDIRGGTMIPSHQG